MSNETFIRDSFYSYSPSLSFRRRRSLEPFIEECLDVIHLFWAAGMADTLVRLEFVSLQNPFQKRRSHLAPLVRHEGVAVAVTVKHGNVQVTHHGLHRLVEREPRRQHYDSAELVSGR